MNDSSRPVIRLLPDVLANRIAAGEVVERPASVIKELVENSIDARATRISVVVEQGGKRLIQVTDNGCGIALEEASTALLRHATSKISCTEDLFNIRTLGFRGEALPAIASVSQLELESRPANEELGVKLILKGGQSVREDRVAMAPGTRISVRNLFFNTPARLKFMRADRTESQHIIDQLLRLALSHTDAGFSLQMDGKPVISVRAGNDERAVAERLTAVFGRDFADNCLEVDSNKERASLFGWLGLPAMNHATASGMYLYVNGRWVRDKIVAHAVREAYGDLLPKGRFPAVALFLDIPPDTVDVNVHPAKHEVRFQHKNFIYSLVRQSVGDALAKLGFRAFQPADLFSRGEPANPFARGATSGSPPPVGPWSDSTPDPEIVANLPAAVCKPVSWSGSAPEAGAYPDPFSGYRTGSAQGGNRTGSVGHPGSPPWPDPRSAATTTGEKGGLPGSPFPQDGEGNDDAGWQGRLDFASTLTERAPEPFVPRYGPTDETESYRTPPLPSGRLGWPLAQLHNTYILAQTDDGFILVDQHAAHERIVYESLKKAFATNHLPRQMLLIPELLELSPTDTERVAQHLEALAAVGVVVEKYGEGEYAVRELPALLTSAPIRTLVMDLVTDFETFGQSGAVEAGRDRVLTTMACHGSVRAGRKLGMEEMESLLRQIEETDHSGQCSHGRPTYVTLTLAGIERLFGRR
ncbi:MAG: DNA mismatch repair endonuclease MutL [Magnetococcales bacterium]|nr:DNA mismatch repair endonuclease MutL [Magnetococcales bacterium]